MTVPQVQELARPDDGFTDPALLWLFFRTDDSCDPRRGRAASAAPPAPKHQLDEESNGSVPLAIS